MSRIRKQYRELSDAEKSLIAEYKDAAVALEQVLEKLPDGREKSLALTNLEQSIMWATQGVTS